MTARGYADLERPEVLALIPETATRILDIGCNGGALGAALKRRQECEVVGMEPSPAAELAQERLDQVFVMDVERAADGVLGWAIPNPTGERADFDCVVMADVLEHLHDPAQVLRWVRHLLAPGGVLVLSVPNARHASVIGALAEGGFTREASGLLDKTHLQHFTRRELEVLLDSCGFGVAAERAVRGAGYEDWDAGGRKGEVRVGRLTVSNLSETEAEEFFVYQWLVVAPPRATAEYPLTSIVIPVFNGLPDTAACIASILRHTPEPIELIVVDNGSTDGTGKWLEQQCPVEVKYIRNEMNRGYPGACNQGAEIATGAQLLFLNNDTLVTPGWLRRMTEALQSADDVAAVGPRSNYVAPPQFIQRHYNTLMELDAWAWGWSLKRWHERMPAHRLVGFCLLVKRDWWEQTGGNFDESFGIGNFEDDDLCQRLMAAGGKLLVANDAFVHHEGNKTFNREGIDLAGLLAVNQAKYAEKWAK